MPDPGHGVSLEEQIDQWLSYLRRRQAMHSVDVAELEDHLREQVAVLVDAGLATDEAFLVAVKRMGGLDALSREFAREHSDRLWKQLVVSPSDTGEPKAAARTDAIVAFCLAVAAALAIKVPALFGMLAEAADRGLQRVGRYHQAIHVLGEMDKTIAVDISAARAELGYEPRVSLYDGMRESIRWCRAQGISL